MSDRTLELTEVLDLLGHGEVDVLGLLPYSSNHVFLAKVAKGDLEGLAIYKPRRGETPLWDFPEGTLAAREVAAFELSESLGWRFVPPTVMRDDAPLGEGSLQLFIDHDPERHYFTLAPERLEDFERFVVFDIVVNNADRKSGHVLEDADGKLWAVDHGLTFNAEPKLRTVIWDLAGRSLSDEARADLERLRADLKGALGRRLTQLLSEDEAEATLDRTERLLREGTFPHPTGDRPVPWPLV